ncbi:hypothetical protein HU830_03550 [Lactobacillus sp. DCY120]|uniref:Uncharacterized protein n=1 Tax=Bombilactobacillus apium TaxID=2675299 RepID=A0A850QZY8_9LACO|nr:hypothetical protein [Bombilactobacillus apium]NVY96253.1 hypothetical protein [Bombilactobacillus apium]
MSPNYQPQDTKDALRYLEKLINQYLNAPLTPELIAYNQKQIKYLEEEIIPYALKVEHQPQRARKAQTMVQALKQWPNKRLSSTSSNLQMRHGQISPHQQTAYQHRAGKHHSQPHYRTSNH